MSVIGRKGAEATARKFRRAEGLDEAKLPALKAPQDAEQWLEIIGRAVATGELPHRDATAAIKAVREWLRAHEAGAVADQLDELSQQVAQLKGRPLERLK